MRTRRRSLTVYYIMDAEDLSIHVTEVHGTEGGREGAREGSSERQRERETESERASICLQPRKSRIKNIFSCHSNVQYIVGRRCRHWRRCRHCRVKGFEDVRSLLRSKIPVLEAGAVPSSSLLLWYVICKDVSPPVVSKRSEWRASPAESASSARVLKIASPSPALRAGNPSAGAKNSP